MSTRRWTAGLALAALALAGALAYRWWTSDERAIRNQLSAIAAALTVRLDEGELAPIGRAATLRKALAPHVRVSAAAARPGDLDRDHPSGRARQIEGRDAVLALVARWIPPPGGVTIEFLDVQVTVSGAGGDAHVSCTAEVTSDPASAEPAVDARELTIGFEKIDGAWLVSSVEPEETLTP